MNGSTAVNSPKVTTTIPSPPLNKTKDRASCKCHLIAIALFGFAALFTALAIVGFTSASFPTVVAIVGSAAGFIATIGGIWALFRCNPQPHREEAR